MPVHFYEDRLSSFLVIKGVSIITNLILCYVFRKSSRTFKYLFYRFLNVYYILFYLFKLSVIYFQKDGVLGCIFLIVYTSLYHMFCLYSKQTDLLEKTHKPWSIAFAS